MNIEKTTQDLTGKNFGAPTLNFLPKVNRYQTHASLRADAYFDYELVRGNPYFAALDEFLHCTKLVSEHFKLEADQSGADQVKKMCKEPIQRMQMEAVGGGLRYNKVYQEFFMQESVLARNQTWQ